MVKVGMSIRRINPVARALLQSRRRTSTVPDRKKYNKKKERQDAKRERRSTVSEDTGKENS
jgi:hypothetical protein